LHVRARGVDHFDDKEERKVRCHNRDHQDRSRFSLNHLKKHDTYKGVDYRF